MKKKTGLYIIGIGLLAITAFLLIKKNMGGNTVAKLAAEYDFRIEDTAAIDRIVISDKSPASVNLLRTSSGWKIDGKKAARMDAIEVLMETLYRQELRNFVPENSKNNVLKNINVSGREVQVFQNGKLVKHFFVGGETPDQNGTYMMIKGASQPYTVHIQGFNGYLSTRFFASQELWMDRTIFGFDNLDIKRAGITYTDRPDQSFEMEVQDLENIQVRDGAGNVLPAINLQAAQYFLATFRSTKYEGLIVPTDEAYHKQDSIKQNQPPAFRIFATNKKDETITLTAYYITAAPDTYDTDGTPYVWDPDRLYAFISDGRFVLIQYYGMGPMLRTLPNFFPQNS